MSRCLFKELFCRKMYLKLLRNKEIIILYFLGPIGLLVTNNIPGGCTIALVEGQGKLYPRVLYRENCPAEDGQYVAFEESKDDDASKNYN